VFKSLTPYHLSSSCAPQRPVFGFWGVFARANAEKEKMTLA
jgi:hypothetical protein